MNDVVERVAVRREQLDLRCSMDSTSMDLESEWRTCQLELRAGHYRGDDVAMRRAIADMYAILSHYSCPLCGE